MTINCKWGHTGTEKDLNPSPLNPKFNPQPLQPPQPELKCHHSLLVTIQFSFGSNKLAWMHLSQKTTRCLKFVSSEGKQEIRKYLGIEREKEKSQHQAGFELTNTTYAIYRFLTTTAPIQLIKMALLGCYNNFLCSCLLTKLNNFLHFERVYKAKKVLSWVSTIKPGAIKYHNLNQNLKRQVTSKLV